MSDVVVIGAGLAGLAAAIRLAEQGREVTVISAGVGGLQLSQGTIDILGYDPHRVSRPLDAATGLAAQSPSHPYAHIDAATTRQALAWFGDLLGPQMLVGSTDTNVHLPTAVGALRPTALHPPSMAAGDLSDGQRVVIAGLRRLKDFAPDLVADNIARAELPGGGRVATRAISIDFPVRDGERDTSGLVTARALDDRATAAHLADAIAAKLRDDDEVVGMPAVLGLRHAHDTWRTVSERLSRPVFEIPLPPPSVPGIRLNTALTERARTLGVRFLMGARVVGADIADGHVTGVHTDTAGRRRTTACDWAVFAPGGFESGALAVDSYGKVTEPVFDLPLTGVPQPPLVDDNYWAEHPLFRAGVAVDATMRPIDAAGDVRLANLVVAGGILAGATRWREKSGEGIAIASAYTAATTVLGDRS